MSRAMDRVKAATITLLGTGHSPVASGTAGSAVTTALFCAVAAAFWTTASREIVFGIALIAATLLASYTSIVWGDWAIARYGRKDPKQFVLDEFAGQCTALAFVPLGGSLWSLAFVAALQFLLFRFFDILKPPPARQFEALPGGWGILCDDLMAGVYANVVGQLLCRLVLAGWII